MPGFAVLPFALVWQARKAVANKKATEEAAPVRSHAGCVASPLHCERHVVMRFVDWQNNLSFTHECAMCAV